MFRRLLFLLLLIGVALPSMAVPAQAETDTPGCHSAVPADSSHHQPDSSDGKTTGHFCIGCVANYAQSIIAEPIGMSALVPPVRPMATLAGASAPPSVPPPRP